MEHSKSKVFHFTRSHHFPNPFINFTLVREPILIPKSIWCYLGFFFNRKLTFHYHVHFYATKCLSILNTMKLLGNSSHGILPIQEQLLIKHVYFLLHYMGSTRPCNIVINSFVHFLMDNPSAFSFDNGWLNPVIAPRKGANTEPLVSILFSSFLSSFLSFLSLFFSFCSLISK